MAMTETAPTAVHRGTDELPFADVGGGSHMQLVQVDLAAGVWIVRNRFDPGTTVQTHKHTGHVYAFTLTGSWHYLESPEAVNTPGSYLFEPAGSIHTLHVPASNDGLTDVWFTIHGANLDLDAEGRVEVVTDAASVLSYYRYVCGKQFGRPDPPVVVVQ